MEAIVKGTGGAALLPGALEEDPVLASANRPWLVTSISAFMVTLPSFLCHLHRFLPVRTLVSTVRVPQDDLPTSESVT